jgi:PhoPQ-activated pathogenicity-related protein
MNTRLLLALLAVASLVPTAVRCPASPRTALDEYVAAPDSHYAFRLLDQAKGEGFTTFFLELTSQAWLTTNEVDRPVWKHLLRITRPDTVASSTALLFIQGGNNNRPPPLQPADGNLVRAALATQSVVAELGMVPNQPLTFAGEHQGRVEDELIAYTWDKFLRTGDARWPARLPMTKAAVRAMDAVTAFCGSEQGGRVAVDRFVVAGGSKRGWTTWTTAAVDPRVVAIVPIVIDVLNVEPSMRHHYAAYGFWAPAIHDYEQLGIMNWVGTPQFRALLRLVDPYSYRDRYTMPKLVLNAAGDQFFLPDSSQFYFDDLPAPKFLRYVPNADHSLKKSDAWETLLAFYHAVVTGASLPRYSWSATDDGALRVRTADEPREVRLWQATNPQARDFRLETLGPVWQSSPLRPQADGTYEARVTKPDQGWTAFFVELAYATPAKVPLKLTTEVRVVPDTVRFEFKPKPVE